MARVIRGRARVVPAEVVGARARAAAILEQAAEEAERTRDTVRAELAAEAEATANARLAAAMLGVEVAREEAVHEVRRQMLSLSMQVARRILGETLAAEPERVRALVAETLGRVARARRAVVRAHPADVPLLEGIAAEVVQDGSLSRGDCVVESDLGDVDARIETRLTRLMSALEETR